MANDDVSKFAVERRLGWQGRGQPPLLALDQIEAGMVFGEAFGRPRKRRSFELRESSANGGLLEQLSKRRMVIEQPVADGGKLVLLRHIGAGGDHQFLCADVKIVACAGGLLQPLVRPPRSD